MFAGTVESLSHEGGLLVSFTGSSPALESIIINQDTGDYIGKVDAVLGNTNAPLVHVAHLDRKLDIPGLVGIQVNIRPKKVREDIKITVVESVDEVLKLALKNELKRIEWTEVENISKSDKDQKSQASIQ